jgi:hypothetical protein
VRLLAQLRRALLTKNLAPSLILWLSTNKQGSSVRLLELLRYGLELELQLAGFFNKQPRSSPGGLELPSISVVLNVLLLVVDVFGNNKASYLEDAVVKIKGPVGTLVNLSDSGSFGFGNQDFRIGTQLFVQRSQYVEALSFIKIAESIPNNGKVDVINRVSIGVFVFPSQKVGSDEISLRKTSVGDGSVPVVGANVNSDVSGDGSLAEPLDNGALVSPVAGCELDHQMRLKDVTDHLECDLQS